MQFLSWFKATALLLSAVVSSALAMLAVGAGLRRRAHATFALFAASGALSAVFALLRDLSVWLALGDPQLLTELAMLFFVLTGPLLFAFTAGHLGARGALSRAGLILALAITAVMCVPLLSHQVVLSPGLSASGYPHVGVKLPGVLWGAVVAGFLAGTLLLLIRRRRETREPYMATGVGVLLFGLAEGILPMEFPLLAVTNALGLLLIGYSVMRRQIFNPLRETTAALENRVAERTRALAEARQGLEERVRERTAELEREVAERRDAEEKFRSLAEQSPNMIFINARGRVVYANRRCEEIVGYTREEFLAPEFDFMCLMAPESVGTIRDAFARHGQGKDVEPYEYVLLKRDGRRLDVIITTRLIAYGAERAILGIITDISYPKRTERLLRGLNAATLLMERAMSPQEIFPAVGEELRKLGLETAILLTVEGEERLRVEYASVTPGPPPAGARQAYAGALELFGRVTRERQTVFSPSPPVPAGHRVSPAIVAPLITEEAVRGVLVVQSDALTPADCSTITVFANQVGAAWRKTRLMEELAGSLSELRATQEQLLQSQKMEAIGRLAGGVAHDFNNLLTAITGYAELLQGELPAEGMGRSFAGEILGAAAKAAGLTRQLLAFSRKQVLEPQAIDLNPVVAGLEGMLRRLIGEHVELEVRSSSVPCVVKADPTQTEQAIMNLVINAADAMPKGGRVTIETTVLGLDDAHDGVPPGEYALLSVRDAGEGMDQEVLSHIFEPFYTTKARGRGTGLGLSTVYGIVKQSGGQVRVESSPGAGSVFRIYLPRSEEQPEAPRPAIAATSRGGKETVLVVEDEAAVRSLAAGALARYGYAVLQAERGDEALRICGSCGGAIDIVVTDVVMPGGMSGPGLAEKLAEVCPSARVLFISGYSEGFIPRDGSRVARIPLLEKPFSPEALARKVREILDAP